jgi:Protein of unknown function (DUF1559)
VFARGSHTPIGGRLFRIKLLEIGERFLVRAQLGPAAAKQIGVGETIRLIRPLVMTTAQMKLIPDWAPILATRQADHEQKLRIARNRMKNQLLALHGYLGINNHFPPAFIVGPDGKPWHSWRALLLPFLNQNELYKAYNFDEPWNGPHNIKLLEKMPEVYSEPLYADNCKGCTPYVAIVGEGTAFSPAGGKFVDPKRSRFQGLGIRETEGGRDFGELKDGPSHTVVLGMVGPERKIPWLKPEDFVVDSHFPPLGAPGGLATPYESNPQDPVGLFGVADGIAATLPRSTDLKKFKTLLTINGKDNPPGPFLMSSGPPFVKTSPMTSLDPAIRCETTKDGVRASYVFEQVENRTLLPDEGPTRHAP